MAVNLSCDGAPPITTAVLAIAPDKRADALLVLRERLRVAYYGKQVQTIRNLTPHFMALDWLVRFGEPQKEIA